MNNWYLHANYYAVLLKLDNIVVNHSVVYPETNLLLDTILSNKVLIISFNAIKKVQDELLRMILYEEHGKKSLPKDIFMQMLQRN